MSDRKESTASKRFQEMRVQNANGPVEGIDIDGLPIEKYDGKSY